MNANPHTVAYNCGILWSIDKAMLLQRGAIVKNISYVSMVSPSSYSSTCLRGTIFLKILSAWSEVFLLFVAERYSSSGSFVTRAICNEPICTLRPTHTCAHTHTHTHTHTMMH